MKEPLLKVEPIILIILIKIVKNEISCKHNNIKTEQYIIDRSKKEQHKIYL